MSPATDEYRSLPSGELRLRVWDGPAENTLVAIHGLGGSVLDWQLLGPLIAPHARFIAADLPGFGRSGPSVDGEFGIHGQVRAIAELIDSEGGSAHVIGNSMGGVDAVHLGVFAPQSARSLTLLSPAFPDLSPRISALPFLALASQRIGREVFQRLSDAPIERQLDGKAKVSFVDQDAAPQSWLDESAELLREQRESPHIAAAYAQSSADLVRGAFDRGPDRPWALAGRVMQPILVTHSQRDRVVRPRLRHTWAAVLPQSRRALFTQAGHVPQLSSPEEVARAWLTFQNSL